MPARLYDGLVTDDDDDDEENDKDDGDRHHHHSLHIVTSIDCKLFVKLENGWCGVVLVRFFIFA